jgi:predicted N-acetyltransferase YhbS
VLNDYQRRGIGSALIEHACMDAVASGADTMVLLATSEGTALHERRSFREVARFGYWYRSFSDASDDAHHSLSWLRKAPVSRLSMNP